jgi:hypothetical protein
MEASLLHWIATIPLLLWSQVCAAHGEAAPGEHALAGPLVGNIIVAALAAIVTVACIIIAARMLIRPGEIDPDHPKHRILQPDR